MTTTTEAGKAKRSSTNRSAKTKRTTDAFSAAERAAMKDRSDEARKEAKRARAADKAAADARDVLAKIDEMPDPDKTLAARLHELIAGEAPCLAPKLWYGMPAYARDGKIVCYFQGADKFRSRYATLGFNDDAHLDHGTLWPVSYALTDLDDAAETTVRDLIVRAVRPND